MKQKCQVMKAAVIALLLLGVLVGCNNKSHEELTVDKLIGVWSGSYEYAGNSYDLSIQFNRNGTYDYIELKNGKVKESMSYNYTIEDEQVKCYLDYTKKPNTLPNSYYGYYYKDGKLTKDNEDFITVLYKEN